MIPPPEEQPLSVPFQQPDHRLIKIIIADDHVLFNDGIKMLLSTEPDICVMQQVLDGREVMQSVRSLLPDLILLDINLPGIDGLELSRKIKQGNPSTRIILLSMYNDHQFIQKAEQLQVNGYLLKTASKDELLTSIRAVINGETCFMVNGCKRSLHQDDDFIKKYKLTKRELEIIKLVVSGQSSQAIADELHLSVFTVETHRRNINLKLGIKNLAELIHMARLMGLG